MAQLNQNPTKTEFIILQLIQNFRRHDEFQIEVGGSTDPVAQLTRLSPTVCVFNPGDPVDADIGLYK